MGVPEWNLAMSFRERHHLDEMAASVGRVVGLADANVAQRAGRETAGVPLGRRKFLCCHVMSATILPLVFPSSEVSTVKP